MLFTLLRSHRRDIGDALWLLHYLHETAAGVGGQVVTHYHHDTGAAACAVSLRQIKRWMARLEAAGLIETMRADGGTPALRVTLTPQALHALGDQSPSAKNGTQPPPPSDSPSAEYDPQPAAQAGFFVSVSAKNGTERLIPHAQSATPSDNSGTLPDTDHDHGIYEEIPDTEKNHDRGAPNKKNPLRQQAELLTRNRRAESTFASGGDLAAVLADSPARFLAICQYAAEHGKDDPCGLVWCLATGTNTKGRVYSVYSNVRQWIEVTARSFAGAKPSVFVSSPPENFDTDAGGESEAARKDPPKQPGRKDDRMLAALGHLPAITHMVESVEQAGTHKVIIHAKKQWQVHTLGQQIGEIKAALSGFFGNRSPIVSFVSA